MLRKAITVTGTKHWDSARKCRHAQQVAHRGNWPGASTADRAAKALEAKKMPPHTDSVGSDVFRFACERSKNPQRLSSGCALLTCACLSPLRPACAARLDLFNQQFSHVHVIYYDLVNKHVFHNDIFPTNLIFEYYNFLAWCCFATASSGTVPERFSGYGPTNRDRWAV